MKNSIRIGFLAAEGKLGYSIRAEAFRRVIQKSEDFTLFDVNTTNLFVGITPGISVATKALLRWWRTNYWKREVFIQYAARRLDRFVSKNHLDILQAETPQSALIWLRSKRLCPCILDMHGILYEEKKLRGKLLTKADDAYWYNVQNDTLNACDHVFVVSEAMGRYLKTSVPNLSYNVIPNGADIKTNVSAKYTFPLSIAYAGIFEYWERVSEFVKMAKLCSDNLPHKFMLIGDGRLKNDILRDVDKNILYLGYLPREVTFSKLSASQVGVVPSSMDITRQVASPIKMFDYMSIGLPVLTYNIGEWSEIVKENGCGVVVEKNTSQALVTSLKTFSDIHMWQEMSMNCKRVIREKYNWEGLITRTAFPVYRRFRVS